MYSRKISIHASRGGSDSTPTGRQTSPQAFQSTLPVGEATPTLADMGGVHTISIHASRGGSDLFSPSRCALASLFQSTLPVGEATDYVNNRFSSCKYFNPRFPWGKRPCYLLSSCHRRRNFNPRFPWGKRPVRRSALPVSSNISIHASRGGSDEKS